MEQLGDNIEGEIKDDILYVQINLKKSSRSSKSGKSISIASTRGNKPLPGREDVKIGINVFRPHN